MGFFARVYRGRNDFDFPFLFRPIVAISSALFIASVVSLIFQGLNLSIDFAGGAVWEVPSKTLTVGQASDVLGQFGKDSGSKVQEANDADGNRILRVRLYNQFGQSVSVGAEGTSWLRDLQPDQQPALDPKGEWLLNREVFPLRWGTRTGWEPSNGRWEPPVKISALPAPSASSSGASPGASPGASRGAPPGPGSSASTSPGPASSHSPQASPAVSPSPSP